MRITEWFAANRQRKRQITADQGFTLIELAIVIAVIGILTIVTIPKYEAVVAHYKLESSAQSVLAELRYAQQMAIEGRQTVYVGFTADHLQLLTGSDLHHLTPSGSEIAFGNGITFVPMPTANGSVGLMDSIQDINILTYQGLSYNWLGFISGASIDPVIVLEGYGTQVNVHVESLTGGLSIVWP